MNEAVREMTFEEEFEILQREKERVFVSEKEGYEPPLANCVLRRALRCIRKLQEQQPKSDWIPCEVEMPKEHDSIFAKFKGTNKWSSGMFEKLSDEVNVTVEFSDGTRKVITTHTADGKWHAEKFSHLKTKVIAWMPKIQPYKKEGATSD